MSMLRGANIFITGCSRGLGLELVKQLVARNDTCNIVATCRSPDTCRALTELASSNTNVHVMPLDVTKFDTFPSMLDDLRQVTQEQGLNILINNAGVAPKSTRIGPVTDQQMVETFTCNVVAPLMITKCLLPELKKGSNISSNPSLIVNMSSILGSIAENDKGALYPYRASKSALNSVTRSLSVDLAGDRIEAVALHPGWVRTDMGGQAAPLSSEASVRGVLDQIDNHKSDNNGGFIDYTGKTLPW